MCKGNTGTLTAKAMKNARNSQRAVCTGSVAAVSASVRRSNVPPPARAYKKMIANSRNAEPAIV